MPGNAFAPPMERANATFAAIFLGLPLLGLLAALFMTGLGAELLMVIAAIAVLVLGFGFAIAFVDV